MIVVDTNVIMAALVSSRGYSFNLFELMLNKQIDYLMSLKLMVEYWQTLTRQENMRLIPLSLDEIEMVLALLVQNSHFQEVYYRWRPNLKDEADNFIMELAIAGNAESIVTFNKKDFRQTQLRFEIGIETPKEFLRRRKLL